MFLGLTYFMHSMSEGELDRVVGLRKSFYLENVADYDATVAQLRQSVVARGLTWGRWPHSNMWDCGELLSGIAVAPVWGLAAAALALSAMVYDSATKSDVEAEAGTKDPDVVIDRYGQNALIVVFRDRSTQDSRKRQAS